MENKKGVLVRELKDYPKGTSFVVLDDSKESSVKVEFPDGKKAWIMRKNCDFNSLGVATNSKTIEEILDNHAVIQQDTEEKEDALVEGQIKLSDITGGKLPKSGIDHVFSIFPDGAFGEYSLFIPKSNPDFIWNPDVLETLILGMKLKERVMLVGLPATGKTEACKQFCSVVKQPFFKVNGKNGLEIDSFVGSRTVENGSIKWIDGTVTVACKVGGFCLIDEVMVIPPDVQMTLQSLYEKGGTLLLDDKPGTVEEKLIVPDDRFQLCLASNTCGTGDNIHMFSATTVQDGSFISRIPITVKVPFMDEEDEVSLINKKTGLDKDKATLLVKFAGLTRQSYIKEQLPVCMDLRNIIPCAKLMVIGFKPLDAIRRTYLDKIGEDDKLGEVEMHIRTVYAG